MASDDLFRMLQLAAKGYCCSQILLILALEEQGKQNRDLIRALGGLCQGMGGGPGCCGALSGGTCLLALYGGKGRDDEEKDERLPVMLEELTDWFRDRFGGARGEVNCGAILGEDAGGIPDPGRCGDLVAETYVQAMEILASHGIDATRGRDDQSD
ncbi:MAG: DVU_1555 family C-GCAxxG-C-C protein [bacterium]